MKHTLLKIWSNPTCFHTCIFQYVLSIIVNTNSTNLKHCPGSGQALFLHYSYECNHALSRIYWIDISLTMEWLFLQSICYFDSFFCKSDVFISGSVHLCRLVFTVNGVIRRQSLLLYECLYSPVYVMWLSCSVCHYVRTDCVKRWFQCMTIVNLISLVIPTNDSLAIMIFPSYQTFSQMNYTENEKISSRVLNICILLYL